MGSELKAKRNSKTPREPANLPIGNDCSKFGRLGASDAPTAVARFSVDPMLRSVWLLQEQERCFAGRTTDEGVGIAGDRSVRLAVRPEVLGTAVDVNAIACDRRR